MRFKFLTSTILLLLICVCALSGCGLSSKFLREKELGLYPTSVDFPYTKWVCQEIDLFFYTLGYGENYLIGSYEVNDVSYRVVANFEVDELNFKFYFSTDICPSKHSSIMVNCSCLSSGFIYTKYSYDRDEKTITCLLESYDAVAEESIPDVLTFKNDGLVAQSPTQCWYAQEIDMYLYSYEDIDCYYRGEIVIGEEKCNIHALEIGNSNYFMLSIENGIVNNLKSKTTSQLIRMHFEILDDQIVARVSDEYLSNPQMFPYWVYDGIVTFKPHFS